jgi:hypothetical protein
MLNYGAAAQCYFGYRTDELMNGSLTKDQQALAVAYDPGLFAGVIPAEPSKVGIFAKTDVGFSSRSATVSFDGAFAINYYMKPDASVDGQIGQPVAAIVNVHLAQCLFFGCCGKGGCGEHSQHRNQNEKQGNNPFLHQITSLKYGFGEKKSGMLLHTAFARL